MDIDNEVRGVKADAGGHLPCRPTGVVKTPIDWKYSCAGTIGGGSRRTTTSACRQPDDALCLRARLPDVLAFSAMSLPASTICARAPGLAGSAAVLVAAGPEPIDHAVNARIRAEARDRSQIMQTLHVLTDVYGPRLTGSPNHKAAAEWAVAEMKKWGFDTGRLEQWDFGHPGWLNERLTAHVVSPVKDALVGEALAWTNGTDGPVRAAATQLVLPERPTAAELTALPRRQGRRGRRPHRAGRRGHAGAGQLHQVAAPPRQRRSGGDVRPGQPAGAAVRSRRPRRSPGAGSVGARTTHAAAGRRAGRRVPRRQQGARPHQRRRPRPRPDPRLQQPDVRRRQGAADDDPAQRGLRPARPPAGRRTSRRTRGRHRQSLVPRGPHVLQRRRRDRRDRTRPAK